MTGSGAHLMITSLLTQSQKSKVVKVGDEVIRFTVVDTMGNEKCAPPSPPIRSSLITVHRFRAVSSSVYAQLDGVIIVFGYDSKESLSKCQSAWLREVCTRSCDPYSRRGSHMSRSTATVSLRHRRSSSATSPISPPPPGRQKPQRLRCVHRAMSCHARS